MFRLKQQQYIRFPYLGQRGESSLELGSVRRQSSVESKQGSYRSHTVNDGLVQLNWEKGILSP